MPDLTFSPASELALPALTEAFNQAFEGYLVPMRHTPESMGAMVRSNDLRLDASLVARTPDATLAGIGLLGVRGDRGWVGGMAVTPALRGAGQGATLLRQLVRRARGLGLKTLQLEVLEENDRARRLYTRHGFEDVRPLGVYTGPLATPLAERPGANRVVAPIGVETALAHYAATHSMAAPWQREEASLRHMAVSLEAHALMEGDRLRAYILAMATGPGYSVMDFGAAAETAEGRARDGGLLISHLMAAADAPVRAINVPPGDPLGPALDACGCPMVLSQREMVLRLD